MYQSTPTNAPNPMVILLYPNPDNAADPNFLKRGYMVYTKLVRAPEGQQKNNPTTIIPH